ncbi:MAG: hypothetical protein WCF23_22745 [Candidatus Nitrosopolaris sp.]
MKRERTKVNVALWNSESYGDKAFHRPCCSSGLSKLIPDPNKDGNMLCRNCGMTFNMNELEKTKTEKALVNQKPPEPMIISQGSKSEKKPKFDTVNNDLDDDTKNELRRMGYRI